jgi:hypothetical protein
LQVAAVLLKTGAFKCRIREHAPNFSPAQKVTTKPSPPLDVGAAVTSVDRAFAGRRLAGLQNLPDDPC